MHEIIDFNFSSRIHRFRDELLEIMIKLTGKSRDDVLRYIEIHKAEIRASGADLAAALLEIAASKVGMREPPPIDVV